MIIINRKGNLFITILFLYLSIFSIVMNGCSTGDSYQNNIDGSQKNKTVIENELPGSSDWNYIDEKLLKAVPSQCFFNNTCPIEAYASKTSVTVGESFTLHVSGHPDTPYTVEIYRLGYYGGVGASLKAAYTPLEKVSRQSMPLPDQTLNKIECSWPSSLTIQVGGEGWNTSTPRTGAYVAKLLLADGIWNGYAYFVPFVVRPNSIEEAEILLVVPDTTWQAYNIWGGAGYYPEMNSKEIGCPTAISEKCSTCCKNKAIGVSFNRPYASVTETSVFPKMLPGITNLYQYEYWYIYWLEQEGYNVAYMSSLDLDTADPSYLSSRYRVLMSVGHDEYWSMGMRDNFEKARGNGAHLIFLSGNTSVWKVRFEGRTMVSYKESYDFDPYYDKDDPIMTGPWRVAEDKYGQKRPNQSPSKINRPESWMHGLLGTTGHWPWGSPKVTPGMAEHWIFSGTGLKDGDVVEKRLHGYEGNEHVKEWAPTDGILDILAQSTDICFLGGPFENVSMSLWAPNSGGMVFNGGSIQWAWLLVHPFNADLRAKCNWENSVCCTKGDIDPPLNEQDIQPSPVVKTITHNILDCFTGRGKLTGRCG